MEGPSRYLLQSLEVRMTCVLGAGTREEGVSTFAYVGEVMTSRGGISGHLGRGG